jgi:hypothetical protein
MNARLRDLLGLFSEIKYSGFSMRGQGPEWTKFGDIVSEGLTVDEVYYLFDEIAKYQGRESRASHGSIAMGEVVTATERRYKALQVDHKKLKLEVEQLRGVRGQFNKLLDLQVKEILSWSEEKDD